jgi:hypothetical protein
MQTFGLLTDITEVPALGKSSFLVKNIGEIALARQHCVLILSSSGIVKAAYNCGGIG